MPIGNKALKGYIYRDPQAANPLAYRNSGGNGQIVEAEGTPVYFRYEPSIGKESDPNAYINNQGQSLVDLAWVVSTNTAKPTTKLKDFGKKNYRSKESMIKQFCDATNRQIYDIPNGVVSCEWQSESDDSWREKYHADKNYPLPEHVWFSDAYQYSAWKRGESYRGRIIDVPGEPDSEEITITEVRSEREIPEGRVFMDYPQVAVGRHERDHRAEQMENDIKNARKRGDRRYSIRYAYGGGNLTEAQVKELGIEKIDDMSLYEDKYYYTKSGVAFQVTRSRNVGQGSKYAQRRSRIGLKGRRRR